MNLEELQKTFGADTVTFRKGPGEFTTVIIDNGAAEAERGRTCHRNVTILCK